MNRRLEIVCVVGGKLQMARDVVEKIHGRKLTISGRDVTIFNQKVYVVLWLAI